MSIEFEVEGKLARVVLANPSSHNALDIGFCAELAEALETASSDLAVCAVLLQARGKSFCVGADLSKASRDPAGWLPRLVGEYHRCSLAVLTMPKPVVVAVQGVAAGGGFSLAMACDVRLAGRSARFRLAYPRVGMAIDGGLSLTLPRLMPRSGINRLVFHDPEVCAEEALRTGLVDRVTSDDELEGAALELAGELAAGPARAYAEIKALLNPRGQVSRVLQREAEAIERCSRTGQAREGIAAFLGKRAPAF